MTKPPNFHLIDYDLLDKRDLELEVPQQQCTRCDHIISEGKFDVICQKYHYLLAGCNPSFPTYTYIYCPCVCDSFTPVTRDN